MIASSAPLKVAEIRGEDIRAGQIIALAKKPLRVLRNVRDRRGGGGALRLETAAGYRAWRGYECHDSFNVVSR